MYIGLPTFRSRTTQEHGGISGCALVGCGIVNTRGPTYEVRAGKCQVNTFALIEYVQG